jgi:hypothetical protein
MQRSLTLDNSDDYSQDSKVMIYKNKDPHVTAYAAYKREHLQFEKYIS